MVRRRSNHLLRKLHEREVEATIEHHPYEVEIDNSIAAAIYHHGKEWLLDHDPLTGTFVIK